MLWTIWDREICIFVSAYLNIFSVRECVCVCVFVCVRAHAFSTCVLTSAYCNLHTEHPKTRVHNPQNCIIWQDAVSMFLGVMLQLYDVRVEDHLVTVSQGALGNHDRHFLNVAKEWPCHDWRNRCYRMIYILLSLWFPAQHKGFRFAL